jgi:hypothetical protein
MLGEPMPHLLNLPRPLKGVGITEIVPRQGGEHMLDKGLATVPGGPFQLAIPERPHQHLRLVQPRGVGRCEAGPPPPRQPDQ